jgi:hypothetical protein
VAGWLQVAVIGVHGEPTDESRPGLRCATANDGDCAARVYRPGAPATRIRPNGRIDGSADRAGPGPAGAWMRAGTPLTPRALWGLASAPHSSASRRRSSGTYA